MVGGENYSAWDVVFRLCGIGRELFVSNGPSQTVVALWRGPVSFHYAIAKGTVPLGLRAVSRSTQCDSPDT